MLALLLATTASAQSPPGAPEPGAVEPQTEDTTQASPPSPQQGRKFPEPFVPTDKISPDSVISFPSDI